MKNRVTQICLAVLLAGLLAVPALYRRFSAHGLRTAHASDAAAGTFGRYGFHLQESAKASGINFVHGEPTLDPKLSHIMTEVASMGAAVSVVDFDRDGWPDIYVVNSAEGSHNALYRNLGNGRFRDVASEVGLADVNQPGTGVSTGAVWGDYDNDGYEDVLVYKWGKPELFHNDAGKHFTRVTEQAGLPNWVNADAAIWFDYDRDGKLDLFLGGYYSEKLDLWHLKNTKIMPNSFEYASNGGRKYLFHNLGGGRFEEVSQQLGIDSHRWALAAVAADFSGSGYPDLFVANDYGVSELYVNEGGKHFREMGKEAGVGYAPKSGMNAAVGDVLNQGRFAIYVSNITEPGTLVQGNNLWMPKAGAGQPVAFVNVASEMGVEMGGWSFGAQFGDLNNDGYLDLYLTNGFLSLDRDRSYWYDYSKIAGGNEAIISDAANWPPLKGRSLAGYQQKHVWINDGVGEFTEVAQSVGVSDLYDGRSVAMADFENRGVLDVVVANQKGPLLLYKNSVTPENHWIEFQLEGQRSNRSAIGAQVRIFWNGMQQLQEVSGGSGFCAQNDRRLHFGLGKTTAIDRVEIRWPSGATQTLASPAVDQLHKVKEPL
jgi:hypothetical protein